MDLSPTRLVAGRYRLTARLGSGGMGTVWRAHDEVLGREVAVKEVTFPQGLSDADRDVLRERTRREARAAARLDHPSAVTVYDVVEDGGAPYLVMELVEARTLADVVRDDGPRTPEETARIGLALLGALDAAHRSGIVHRDVKPSNVLVRDDGRVVLTDFGIATTTGDPSITHTGLLLGSPAYLSPERARGEAPGPPADLWSLGATLFTAVEGRPPFDQDDALATVMAVVTGEHAPYALAGPLVPVLDGLLVKDPARRLDAAAAERLLREVAEGSRTPRTQVLPVPPPTAVPPVPPPAASRTTALDVGEVRSELAAARPARPRPVAAPAPAPAARRRGRGALTAAAAVLLVGAGTAAALIAGGDRDPGTAAGTASAPSAPTQTPDAATQAPETEAPQTQAPETSAPETEAPQTEPPQTPAPETQAPETGGGAVAVPAGWSTDDGGAGWTVALPPGYSQTRAGEYRDRATGRTLRVETGQGQPDAVADRERAARGFARRHPTYEQIRIEPVDYRGYEAADWEFTYEGLHVINRVFVVDGTGHSLFFQYREGDAAAAEDFEGIVRGFTPAE